MNDLDQRLLKAHETQDADALVRLYTQAANQAGEIDAACFYLTHAYVFALEHNHPDATALRSRLEAHGREQITD